MKRSLNKIISLVLSVVLGGSLASFAAGCGDSSDPKTLKFYSWGNETEVELTRQLVADFNRTNPDGITVEFTPVPTGDYEQKVTNALRGRNVPGVIVAGDGEIKSWIGKGGIAALDEFAANSEVIDLDDMWQDGVARYRFDTASKRGGTGKLYGIMRDYSPSVLFYNKDALAAVGVECISLDKAASLAQYGTDEAFFQKDDKYYFNNLIPLKWDTETGGTFLQLAQKLTSNPDAPVRNNSSITKYGLYVIHWFCFGWSVGGNCLEWAENENIATGGKYEFTLFDESKNYIVDSAAVTVGEKTYQPGEIVSYSDKGKLTADDRTKCIELPSQMEAMQYFVDMSVSHKVSPKPDVTDSNSTYGLFSSEQCAMLIDTRYAVGIFRKTIGDAFDWDVAPLPVYKDGIAAGHSGSLAYAIPEKSSKKEAAWKFIEYMAGPQGEARFAEAGFTIPNTMSMSESDTFLQPGKKPANSRIFVDAAYYQKTGDWGYLPSKAWINEWAVDLNNSVLGGKMTLTRLRDLHQSATQTIIDNYYGG